MIRSWMKFYPSYIGDSHHPIEGSLLIPTSTYYGMSLGFSFPLYPFLSPRNGGGSKTQNGLETGFFQDLHLCLLGGIGRGPQEIHVKTLDFSPMGLSYGYYDPEISRTMGLSYGHYMLIMIQNM